MSMDEEPLNNIYCCRRWRERTDDPLEGTRRTINQKSNGEWFAAHWNDQAMVIIDHIHYCPFCGAPKYP